MFEKIEHGVWFVMCTCTWYMCRDACICRCQIYFCAPCTQPLRWVCICTYVGLCLCDYRCAHIYKCLQYQVYAQEGVYVQSSCMRVRHARAKMVSVQLELPLGCCEAANGRSTQMLSGAGNTVSHKLQKRFGPC